MNAPIDTSHIRSPRDPMTPAEREAVREEIRAELAMVDAFIAEHGGPWQGMLPDWTVSDEDAA